MSSQVAIALLSGLISLLVGLLVGRGLLKRRQAEKCRQLASDLTDKVHDRCDAYRRLEQRISGVIGEFEHGEIEPLDEPVGAVAGRRTAASAAARAEGLAWMDACAGSCPPAQSQQPTETKTVESEIDVFAERLRGAQDSNRALIEDQSRAIAELERRIASMETSPRTAPPPPPAARRAMSPDAELAELTGRLARSEQDLAEWRARSEQIVQEREASIARAREALAQLRPSPGCERCDRANDLAQQIVDLPPARAERETRRAQPVFRPEPQPFTPPVPTVSHVASEARTRDVEELEQRLASKQKAIDAMKSELARASRVIDGNRTHITHLMRSLEQTQAKAEERRRQVEEQTSQVSEAYSMLDRMRPLLRAIEGAAEDEQSSALTPEYLEARARG